MKYEILGPIRVFVGDRKVALSPRAQRFLVPLLMAGGRRVGHDALADQVWDEEAEVRDPVGQLRACASEVRAELGARDLVLNADRGYRLNLDRAEVDAFRFRAKATTARTCADEAEAVELWRSALAEWPRQYEPEPLAGLAGRWVESLRYALLAERREALVACLTRQLQLRRTPELLAEIQSYAGEFGPADEDMTYLLMLGLYLNNQPNQALWAYDRTVASLDTLRTRPGPQLIALEKRIRHQDPTLGTRTGGVLMQPPIPEPPHDAAEELEAVENGQPTKGGNSYANIAKDNARVGNQNIITGSVTLHQNMPSWDEENKGAL